MVEYKINIQLLLNFMYVFFITWYIMVHFFHKKQYTTNFAERFREIAVLSSPDAWLSSNTLGSFFSSLYVCVRSCLGTNVYKICG